jgi:hypothetical protein
VSEAGDQAWLEALAGRQSADDGPDAREAYILREAILEHLGGDVLAPRSDDAERLAALIERARREGLIVPRAPRRTLVPLGIAATIICAVGATAMWNVLHHGTRTTQVQRGGREDIVHLRASDPLQLKQQILQELQSAGVSARGYESFGVQGIDADLPRPTPPAVEHILREHGIPTPVDGILRVEISARSEK